MESLLVIPDVHQDIDFVGRILDREPPDAHDQVIFLGDYFDARDARFANPVAVERTALFLKRLVAIHGGRIRLCWGNHDLSYYQFRPFVTGMNPAKLRRIGSDRQALEFLERARWVNQFWGSEMWDRLELAVLRSRTLFLHAGLHPSFWPVADSAESAFAKVLERWNGALAGLREGVEDALFGAGAARGGEQAVGGPLWLDWEDEFVDEGPFRQVVGHTAGAFARRKGRSWCIDCAQTRYAVVRDGELTIRRV